MLLLFDIYQFKYEAGINPLSEIIIITFRNICKLNLFQQIIYFCESDSISLAPNQVFKLILQDFIDEGRGIMYPSQLYSRLLKINI